MGSYLTPGIFSGLGQGIGDAVRLFTMLREAEAQRAAEERQWQAELEQRRKQLEVTQAEAQLGRKHDATMAMDERQWRGSQAAEDRAFQEKERGRERMQRRAAQEQDTMARFRIMGPQSSGAPSLPQHDPMRQIASEMPRVDQARAHQFSGPAASYSYIPEPPSRSINTSILAGERGGAGSLGARIQNAFAAQLRAHAGTGFSATGVSGAAQREIYRNVLQTFVSSGELSPQQAERALAEFRPQNITTLMQQYMGQQPGMEPDSVVNAPAPAVPPGARPGGPTRTRF